jgi:hypothetical protein
MASAGLDQSDGYLSMPNPAVRTASSNAPVDEFQTTLGLPPEDVAPVFRPG